MSLERTALRLATVMLLSNGSVSPFPTMAAGRVYDARIDAVQITNEDEVLALITVNTDDDNGTSLSENNGGPPFERAVTLSIDLHLGLPSGSSDLMHLATESDLERRLDLFEYQVERLLTERPGVWGGFFDAIARRITSWSSIRYVEPDGNVRLAARLLQMTVLLPLSDSMVAAPGDPPQAASLPEPLGPLLDAIINSTSPFAADASQIRDDYLASGAGSRTLLQPLYRVRIFEADTDADGRPTSVRVDGIAEADTTG